MDDYILERTAMPDTLVRNAVGDTAFQEEAAWVSLSVNIHLLTFWVII